MSRLFVSGEPKIGGGKNIHNVQQKAGKLVPRTRNATTTQY